jgi:hypothetical protein
MQAGSASIGPVTDAVAYLAAARGLNAGVEALAANNEVASARAYLAAQTLECILKSYLAHKNVPEGKLRAPAIRHNLEKLWKLAFTEGAPIQQQPTAWCVRLNELHDKPYYLRYPMGLHGLVLPGSNPMVSDLKAIMASISELVQPQ